LRAPSPTDGRHVVTQDEATIKREADVHARDQVRFDVVRRAQGDA
jgi:hypothetical protein